MQLERKVRQLEAEVQSEKNHSWKLRCLCTDLEKKIKGLEEQLSTLNLAEQERIRKQNEDAQKFREMVAQGKW